METKSLLIGIISFIAGALLVSTAAVTINKPAPDAGTSTMVRSLHDKHGDEFDETFLLSMIEHHVDAVEMAKLSERQAKHDEIKALSRDIITAQQKEIEQMQQWQAQWNYSAKKHNEH